MCYNCANAFAQKTCQSVSPNLPLGGFFGNQKRLGDRRPFEPRLDPGCALQNRLVAKAVVSPHQCWDSRHGGNDIGFFLPK